MPIVLVGADFWQRAVNFDFLVEQGVISPDDLDLFTVVETAEEAAAAIYDYYGGDAPATGRKATD
jgi:predicted Rossmann-fold nucleotide-binding protein